MNAQSGYVPVRSDENGLLVECALFAPGFLGFAVLRPDRLPVGIIMRGMASMQSRGRGWLVVAQ